MRASRDVSPRWRWADRARRPTPPLYARAVYSPRPGGRCCSPNTPERTSRSTSTGRSRGVAAGAAPRRTRQGRLDALADDAVPAPTEASPSVRRPSGKGSPALVVATRREPTKALVPFANLLEFAVAVNRADPTALSHRRAAVRARSRSTAPMSGSCLGRCGFVASFPTCQRIGGLVSSTRSARAPRFPTTSSASAGGRLASELGHAQLRRRGGQSITAGCRSPGCRALAAIARVWGEAAIRQLQFREMAAPPATSAFASLLQAHPHAGEVGHARSAVTARLRRAKRPALRQPNSRIRDLPARSREGSSGTPESWCARL